MNVLRVSSGGEPYNEKLGNLLSKSFPNAKIKNIYASTEYGTLFASTGEYFTIKKKYDDKVRIVKNQIEVHKSLVNLKNIKTHEDWYRTGDIVKFDKQKRNFKILGRDTDAINIGGFLVNLLEIESYILNIDGIRNCRVYAKKNNLIGNLLLCDVVAEGEKLSSKHIMNELLKDLPKYKIPRFINFVNDLEKTRSGKIKR